MSKKNKRGRPVGWRKPDARRAAIAIRVHTDEKAAIEYFARKAKITVNEFIRKLFYDKYPPLRWPS